MKISKIFCLHRKAVVNGNGIDTMLSSYGIPYDFRMEFLYIVHEIPSNATLFSMAT